MKKDIGLHSIILSMPETNVYSEVKRLNHYYLMRFITIIFMTVAMLLIFTVTAQAQSMTAPDLSPTFSKNKKEMKEIKREKREEKESTRAVENIPQAIMDRFHVNFPNAKDVAWSVPEGYVEVDFTTGTHHRMAFYDYNNHLMGTGKFVSYTDIPSKGREKIAKEYAGYTPVKAMFYDDNEDNELNMTLYGVPITKDAYFAQLKKGDKQIVIQVDRDGEISYFGDVK